MPTYLILQYLKEQSESQFEILELNLPFRQQGWFRYPWRSCSACRICTSTINDIKLFLLATDALTKTA